MLWRVNSGGAFERGSRAGLIAASALLPSVSYACGQCTDTMVSRIGWWTFFPVCLVGALLVDRVFSWTWLRLRGERPSPRVGAWLVGITVGFLLVALGTGAILSAVPLCMVLCVQFVRSLRRWSRERPATFTRQAIPIRVAVVIGAAFALGATSLPGMRSTPSLVRQAEFRLGAPRALMPSTWVERELARRPEGVAAVAKYLDDALGAADSTAELFRAARLYAAVGGGGERLNRACETLLSGPGEPDTDVNALCANAPR